MTEQNRRYVTKEIGKLLSEIWRIKGLAEQEYLISAIPSVGPSVARNLLRHFGSIEKVMIASEEELKGVAMVGPKIAERIRELVGGEYKG